MSSKLFVKKVRQLERLRIGYICAALLIPSILFYLGERQARRLDALAERGEETRATVTRVSEVSRATFYAYRVDGTNFTWDVERKDAPFSIGETFPIIYLPDNPSFNRPYTDHTRAASEASENRTFMAKTSLALILFFLIGSGTTHFLLLKVRAGAIDPNGPLPFRTRIIFFVLTLLPLFILISEYHIRDSAKSGSLWSGISAVTVSTLMIVGIMAYLTRGGEMQAAERSRSLMRWVVPLAVVAGLIRIVIAIFAH